MFQGGHRFITAQGQTRSRLLLQATRHFFGPGLLFLKFINHDSPMARSSLVILLCCLFGFLESDTSCTRPDPKPSVCTIPLTQILRIPVSALETQGTPESLNNKSATLVVSSAATDEVAEGPTGFDVLDDGGVLITDPLRSRISRFDSQGKFLSAWKVGFAVDSLRVLGKNEVLVREASTGKFHALDNEGQVRSMEGLVQPEQAEARILNSTNGTIKRPNFPSGPLMVELNKPGLTLLSLESLVTDQKGDTYVALETTADRKTVDTIDLNKYVRRYSSDGKLLCEIADIPLDYYVPPVDELRVRKGKVYQLQTTSSEVRINVWDTNRPCATASH